MAKIIKNTPQSVTRRVLFEKKGLCPDIEQVFYHLLSASDIQYDTRFPYSELFIINDAVVFEHDYGRGIFKFNTEMFWNQSMNYFEDYGKVQEFSRRLLRKYLGLKDCEPKPLRSIFILQLNQEMWEASRPRVIHHR